MKQPADIILVNHKESERISKTGSVTWAEHSWGYVPSWCGDVWARCSVSVRLFLVLNPRVRYDESLAPLGSVPPPS